MAMSVEELDAMIFGDTDGFFLPDELPESIELRDAFGNLLEEDTAAAMARIAELRALEEAKAI